MIPFRRHGSHAHGYGCFLAGTLLGSGFGNEAQAEFSSMKTAVVIGNPKAKSRTRDAGVLVAEKLTGRPPSVVLDLVDLGPALLEFGNAAVADAVKSIQDADVVVFASPTFKATYTGLLKLFLDQIPSDGLANVTAFPVMLGAGLAHAMAPEYLLKPVLVELGATCPAPGLYLIDKTFAEDPRLDAWVARVQKILPRHTVMA
jgi:FMN reductase